jgi:hypothetical protein
MGALSKHLDEYPTTSAFRAGHRFRWRKPHFVPVADYWPGCRLLLRRHRSNHSLLRTGTGSCIDMKSED